VTRPFLICFAGDRWDGNPHSRHHLMRRFAGDFEVLFVESLPMRPLASVERTELRRAARKLASGLRAAGGLRTPEPHLHVLSAAPIPPAGRPGRAAQLATVRAQVGRARRRLGAIGPAVSWFSVPIAGPLRGRLHERGSILYYQDRYDAFTGVDAPLLRRLTADLARGCDATVATSPELAADLRGFGADPLLVPHGVDTARFAGEPPAPDDLAGLERPLVGYVGILDDYLDLAAIRATAERLARGTIVLVGAANTDVSMLQHPRIAQLGFRPYATIPAYLAAFGCCLVPFRLTRLTAAVDPIKLREYLAAGRPVVATSLPAVRRYGDVVELAGPGEFADAVQRALDPACDRAAARARRRERVSGESWDGVAERLRPLLLGLAGVASPSRGGSGIMGPCAE
jgi:glycosyltransferase involved in cell wall biosynthesis